MSDKSNTYGYVSGGPTQAAGDNDGVFEVNDIIGLLADGQWSLQEIDVTYLVVAGGAGGGYDQGGGGGAGGLITSTGTAIPSTSYTVTVGSGGASRNSPNLRGNAGNDSVLNLDEGTFTAVGGGGGGSLNAKTGGQGGSGGAGSGGNGSTGGTGATSSASGQGNSGGNGNNFRGGGGGGASANGANAGTNGGDICRRRKWFCFINYRFISNICRWWRWRCCYKLWYLWKWWYWWWR